MHIDNLRKESRNSLSGAVKAPLIERLNEYPEGGVDLNNIVQYPPKLALIPMKPIFLDVAWNYIDYPGQKLAASKQPKEAAPETKPAPQQPKKGWFGFGRS